MYITKQGDVWDAIAKKVYGDRKFTYDLMRANSAYLETSIFSSGVVLVIPEVDKSSVNGVLPPWRS